MEHKIKQVLEGLGMTQKTLAEKTGLTEVGISKMIVSGKASVTSLRKIANAVGLDVEDLRNEEHLRKAKYEGVLKIGEKELPCAVLDDGTRVISATAVFEAFDRPRKGKSNEGYRADQMPSFINANNLQPFVDEQLKEWTGLIDYIGLNGIRRQSYNARILRGLCKVYIDAGNAGALLKSQLRFVPISQAILYSLSDIGIIALVDEATGYDKEKTRAKDELQKILQTFLVEEAAKWVKQFDDQFFEDIYKMRNWTWANTSKRPGVVGLWIRDIVYERLAPVLPELDKRNPKNENGNRSHKHHQYLSKEVGLPRLKQHLEAVHAIAVISNYNWERFMYNLDKAYPRKYSQRWLDFEFDE